jgi:NAD(P)-dependent dehydrogenase (short-subunit alcohol dehydrogenase family)
MQLTPCTDGIAIVTGAAGGIGAGVARQLVAAGWSLLLTDLDAARTEAVAAPLRNGNNTVEVFAGNCADADFCTNLLAALGGRPLGAVVHVAGLTPSARDAELIHRVNLEATINLVNAVRPRIAENGAVVLIASMSAYMVPVSAEILAAYNAPTASEVTAALLKLAPTPEAAYAISKRGVIAVTKREAKAFGARKARIVSISPGLIDTAMSRAELSQATATQRMLEASPLSRLGQPDEIGTVAAFLCSPAASFISGIDIPVDGGLIAAMGL